MYPAKQTFFILGLSKSGKAAAEFLLARGATVYIYDDIQNERIEKTAQALEELGARRVVSEQVAKIAERCDILVLSPGIPVDHPLAVSFKRSGRAVVGETELAARYMTCPIIAITGTNGKTTTVSLLTEVLNAGGYTAHACGNVGTPMLEYAHLPQDAVAVAEISSFQLETLTSLRPHIAIVLNITEDHLNRHYNMENYVFLKSKLLKRSTEAEYAVLNYDDKKVRAFAETTKARTLFFSVREKVNGAYYQNGNLYFGEEKLLSETELAIGGLHNVQNALATIAAAKLMGVSSQNIVSALTSFKGVKHRIEEVGVVSGVKYIDDSKGTNVDATIKAVACMKGETILLLGGKDKGYAYAPLFSTLKNSPVVHAVLYGENRYTLLKCAREQGFDSVSVCPHFTQAVQIANMLATQGQIVLLSPASASFDEFTSYEERGDTFVQIVQKFQQEAQRFTSQNEQIAIAEIVDEPEAEAATENTTEIAAEQPSECDFEQPDERTIIARTEEIE